MTQERGVLEQVAEIIGGGWQANPHSNGDADGYLLGPGGEVVYTNLRAFAEWGRVGEKPYVVLRTRCPGVDSPGIYEPRAEGETVATVAAQIKALVPAWSQAHTEDLAKCEEIIAPLQAFAVEVASHMPEGWTGGAEDSNRNGYSSDDRFNPVAFVANGKLRVQWFPLGWEYGRRFGTPGSYVATSRLRIRGRRGATDQGPQIFFSDNPEITVAASRGAKAVAGEITRRILPGYLEALTKADEEEARHSQAVTGATKLAEIVKHQFAGLEARDNTRTRGNETLQVDFSKYNGLKGGLYLSGEVQCHKETASLTFRVNGMDAAAAKIIMGAIAKACAKLREG